MSMWFFGFYFGGKVLFLMTNKLNNNKREDFSDYLDGNNAKIQLQERDYLDFCMNWS